MIAKYAGQCLCGEIHYSVDVEPIFAGNCHCKDCQMTSGSAYVPAMLFPEKSVNVIGEAKYFESMGESGNIHRRGFCPNCGSQLFAKLSNMPGMMGIKAGTLYDTSSYEPKLDFYVASASRWDYMNPQILKKQGSAQGGNSGTLIT